MVIRLKIKRQEEERISKLKGLMDMFPLADRNRDQYQYQPIGASNISSAIIDPRIQKTKDLFQMFHLAR